MRNAQLGSIHSKPGAPSGRELHRAHQNRSAVSPVKAQAPSAPPAPTECGAVATKANPPATHRWRASAQTGISRAPRRNFFALRAAQILEITNVLSQQSLEQIIAQRQNVEWRRAVNRGRKSGPARRHPGRDGGQQARRHFGRDSQSRSHRHDGSDWFAVPEGIERQKPGERFGLLASPCPRSAKRAGTRAKQVEVHSALSAKILRDARFVKSALVPQIAPVALILRLENVPAQKRDQQSVQSKLDRWHRVNDGANLVEPASKRRANRVHQASPFARITWESSLQSKHQISWVISLGKGRQHFVSGQTLDFGRINPI